MLLLSYIALYIYCYYIYICFLDYILEGIISSGKTTVCSELKTLMPSWGIYAEPVGEFCKLGSVNPLEDFYRKPRKYGFRLQTHIFNCSLRQQKTIAEKDTHDLCVIERGPESCRIFTEVLHNAKILEDPDYILLRHNYASATLPINLKSFKKIFFLDIDIDVALNRIILRDRKEETNIEGSISREYLASLRKEMMTHYPLAKTHIIDCGDKTPNIIAREASIILI